MDINLHRPKSQTIPEIIEAKCYANVDGYIDSAKDTMKIVNGVLEVIEDHLNCNNVIEFHKMFDHPIANEPTVDVPIDLLKLRFSLIFEELYELAIAFGDKGDIAFFDVIQNYYNKSFDKLNKPNPKSSKVEVLDAFADLDYVIDGFKIATGFHTVILEAQQRVHESNMSKSFSTKEEAIEYSNLIPASSWERKDNYYVVYNREGKILKNPKYQPVDLRDLVDIDNSNKNT